MSQRHAFLRAARDADPAGRMSYAAMMRAEDLFTRAAAEAWAEHMAVVHEGSR